MRSGRPFEDRIADRAVRHYAQRTDPFRIEHTVQVTSFGGSGTTALCRHLLEAEVDLQPGPAQWPFKHRRTPPGADQVPDGFSVVYIIGDPRDAVVSLFRRGYQLGHYTALHERDPDEDEQRRMADLATFVAGRVDLFELADHVHGWRNHPAGYRVLFVHYRALRSEWPTIAEFVGLPADHPPLPAQRRNSDWQAQPSDIREGLQVMYGELAREIETMGPTSIV